MSKGNARDVWRLMAASVVSAIMTIRRQTLSQWPGEARTCLPACQLAVRLCEASACCHYCLHDVTVLLVLVLMVMMVAECCCHL